MNASSAIAGTALQQASNDSKGVLSELQQSIDDLGTLYKSIERGSLSIPTLSFRPIGIYSWNLLKAEIFLLLDLVLIVPVNVIVLVRNLFPGKWKYWSLSWPYIAYAARWIWRGEAIIGHAIVFRPLVVFLLTRHFRKRLLLVRRYIALLDGSAEEHKALISQIDELLGTWDGPRLVGGFFTYGLPLAGFFLEVYRTTEPQIALSPWSWYLVFILFTYSLGFVGTAFTVKRGLVLGALGRDCYFPGAIGLTGGYGEERTLLKRFDIQVKEFPLDIVIGLAGICITFFGQEFLLKLLAVDALSADVLRTQLTAMVGSLFFLVTVYWFSYFRRNRLLRL